MALAVAFFLYILVPVCGTDIAGIVVDFYSLSWVGINIYLAC